MTEHLVNPSRTAMQQELGRECRAMIDLNDDLYVWRTEDNDHLSFAEEFGLCGKAWLYIDPARAKVVVSSYSHSADYDETRQLVKSHPRMKFYDVDDHDGDGE